MPIGGLISGAPSGLKLQPTSPGTQDSGNANISGTMLLKNIGNTQFPNNSTLALSHQMSINAAYTGSAIPYSGNDNLMIGNNVTLPNWTLNNTRETIVIGSNQAFTNGAANLTTGIMIGNSITASPVATLQNSIFIGHEMLLSGANNTASLGIGTQVSINNVQSTVVGNFATATGAGGHCVFGYTALATGPTSNTVLGYVARDGGNTDCTVVGAGVQLIGGRNNACVIGTLTQTDVSIGSYKIGQSTGKAVTADDTSPTIQVGTGQVLYTSITAARAPVLPLANSVPLGFTVTITDASGSASAVNTITATRQGADTINAGTVDPLPIIVAYGSRSFISDGVSKWIAKN